MLKQSSYPEWKAPLEDSKILIWPDAQKLLADTRENFGRLSNSDCVIDGTALKDLRRQQRDWMKLPNDRPVVATGHQTELYHAGVWAKLALVNAAAGKLGGDAIHLAVDTDAPKHLRLRWPGGSRPITDDSRLVTAHWSGLLKRPSDKYLDEVRSAFAEEAKKWPFKPMVFEFLDYLKGDASQSNLSTAIVHAQHRLDETLGLRHRPVMASTVWNSPGYLALAHHLMSRADQFAGVYNAALGEYRVAHRLRNTARPMPDLRVDGDRCESPFWVDDLIAGTRDRAMISRRGTDRMLVIGKESIVLDSAKSSAMELQKFLQAQNSRLAPRALTLTLFTRLLVADQFVHGIGGGRYDQVTDRVIENFFGIAPPEFSVSTATIYFPTAVGKQQECLPFLIQEGHRLRHSIMDGEKTPLVEQIAQAPRRSIQRQQLYVELHNKLSAAVLKDPRMLAWQKRVDDCRNRKTGEAALFDRELFYAIQPRERLEMVIAEFQRRF